MRSWTMNKIIPNTDSTAFSPLFSLQSTILTRMEMRTEYKNRWCWCGEWLVKGSSAFTFRREMSGEPPSPNSSGELTPRGRAWTVLQTHSFDKQHKNHVLGGTLQTAKINRLEMGLIRTKLLSHDIIGFSTSTWSHITNKFCVWRSYCVFSPEKNKRGVFASEKHFQQWCRVQVRWIFTLTVMLAKIVVVLWVTVSFSCLTVKRTPPALKYQELFHSHGAIVNISVVEARCPFWILLRCSCLCSLKELLLLPKEN